MASIMKDLVPLNERRGQWPMQSAAIQITVLAYKCQKPGVNSL